MKKFLLYGHGGAYNHGAEAIVQTTVALINEVYNNAEIILSTHFEKQDREFKLPIQNIIEKDNKYFELDKKCEKRGTYNKQIYKDTLEMIDDQTICLSIGGDNYCYGVEHRLYTIHQCALEKKAKSILWGCSIEPKLINDEMIANLKTHHCVVTRESFTYKALLEKQLTNVKLIPDPAFYLVPHNITLPNEFEIGNTVGINISPLIVRKEVEKGIVISSIIELLNFIINKTDMRVALIPHVMMEMDNDYKLLEEIYQTLDVNQKRRVVLIGSKHSAAEYKYIVANCRFIISARTHIAIAGYSSCIPTLAIGYSVKALGLSNDIMGSTEKYCIDISEINNVSSLVEKFKNFMREEQCIKEHLNNTMPKYKEKVLELKKILVQIIK